EKSFKRQYHKVWPVSEGHNKAVSQDLLMSEDRDDTGAPTYKDSSDVRYLARLTADLSCIPANDLAQKTGKDGRQYYSVHYDIEMTYYSAHTKYAMVYKNVKYDSVTAGNEQGLVGVAVRGVISSSRGSARDNIEVTLTLISAPTLCSDYNPLDPLQLSIVVTFKMSAPTNAEKKSKFKFSSLLHSKDKPDAINTTAKDPLTQRNSNTDSGYGGSDPSVTAPSSHVPPSFTGSDESHADRDNNNNETVTTTTTTTTTTTSGGRPVNTSIENNGPSSEYNNRAEGGGSPPIPVRSSLRDRSPNPPSMQQGNAGPTRDRSPMGGTSPGGRTNFSYPNRGGGVMGGSQMGGQHMGGQPMGGQPMGGQPMGGQPPMGGPQMTPQQQHNQGTLQGLKNAAIGIHGAGETLRGTLNAAVDRRTGAPAERLMEHDRVLAAGRQEMEIGRMPENGPQQMPPKGILKKY
ncbi:MAG: hypothetical protein Q9226_007276, partial [Calogaya cf. arnoldii]